MARASMTLLDYSLEKTTFSVTSQELTAANFDGQVTAFTNLRAAAQALTRGNPYSHTIQAYTLDAGLVPTDPDAQREDKWLITYQGNVSGKTFQVELGTAERTVAHLAGNTDVANMSDADWVAFKAAFEAFVRSPDDVTEQVTMTGARLVGRNI